MYAALIVMIQGPRGGFKSGGTPVCGIHPVYKKYCFLKKWGHGPRPPYCAAPVIIIAMLIV